MKQLLLIVNPSAGVKKAARFLSEIVSVFNRAEYDTRVYITSRRGDAAAAVKSLGTGADLVVCCGGDGTLNETVNGMVEADLHVPIGYIPTGSTNDFAHTLCLSDDVVRAARQIVNGTAQPYDVGRFAGRCFTYVASFGAFTKTSYSTPQNVKNAIGRLAYILEGIQEFSKLHKEHVRVEADGEVLEGDYLFGAVCNSTSVGGVLTLDPKTVDMADGKFELLLVRAPKDLQELGECLSALHTQKYDGGMITLRRAATIKVTVDHRMPWSLDGERASSTGSIRIKNLHRRMWLMH